MAKFTERLAHAWNAFMSRDPTYNGSGGGYSYRPDRQRMNYGNERTIINSILNRMAIDTASIQIEHVRLDADGRYIETIDSEMNGCFSVSANVDQTGRAFFQDVVLTMLDEGSVAIVPVDTDLNPLLTGSFDIKSMRVGSITEWFPDSVRVNVYNEKIGRRQEIVIPKRMCAIVENPFYSVMNKPNSTLQRLIRKLTLLDYVDEISGSGKLDLIIQLPYVIKSEARRVQAEKRRNEIKRQLSDSDYGIAYTDGTEHITQLNRSVENKLLSQIDGLTSMLYSQLGITKEIMEGSADANTMNSYYSRTIEPIVSAIVDEMKRKFLTKTARSQSQSIVFFRDPFKLVPISDLAELVDKFTRNEVMTSNEWRQIIGLKPSSNPNADELRNKNLSQSNVKLPQNESPLDGQEETNEKEDDAQNGI